MGLLLRGGKGGESKGTVKERKGGEGEKREREEGVGCGTRRSVGARALHWQKTGLSLDVNDKSTPPP